MGEQETTGPGTCARAPGSRRGSWVIRRPADGLQPTLHPLPLCQVVRVNLMSSFAVLRAAAKAMLRPAAGQPGGAVVLCSSAVARHGIANHEAIAAAKVGGWVGGACGWVLRDGGHKAGLALPG